MHFYRNLEKDLLEWSKKLDKKPLILHGARQVGKTTLLRSFGKQYFGNTAYFNLERQPELHDFFKVTKDPGRIMRSLALTLDFKFDPLHHLIIFDEIQACGEALTALKYFQEEAPEYTVIAAGSLIGVSLGEGSSFPVGKVEFMDLHPLSFEEYLRAVDAKSHKAFQHFLLEEILSPIPMAFYNPISERFKEYMICGGMPEIVAKYVETSSILAATEVKKNLLQSYASDFSKYTDRYDALKVGYIWNSLPWQLAKENKKFLYKAVRTGARAREYESALHWLIKAGLILIASNISVPRLPLQSYNDLSAFKLYALDVGLLFEMSGLEPKNYIQLSKLLTEFKGALTENYVAQALRAQGVQQLHYWESAGKAEIDFLLQDGGNIIPVEVKAGTNTKAKSLKSYKDKYDPPLTIKLSLSNLSFDGQHLNVPLFYAGQLRTLLEKTKSQSTS